MGIGAILLLGVIQGLTEFLPVSSSGHLVLAQVLLGDTGDSAPVVETALHLGTLGAILAFYRKDVGSMILGGVSFFRPVEEQEERRKLVYQVMLATLATGTIGLTFRDFFEGMFESPRAVGVALLFTGSLLMASRFLREPEQSRFGLRDAFLLGIAQGMAIMPGISRSGMTIAVALALGAQRGEAARLSFLIAIPATLGAAILEGGLHGIPEGTSALSLLGGVAAAGIVGYVCLIWLNAWVRGGRLYLFAYYLFPVGIITLIAT